MLAGISRSMIFSKSVLLITNGGRLEAKWMLALNSGNDQGAAFGALLRAEAGAKEIDDLIVQALASAAPPLGASELFDANAQPVEAEDLWGELEISAQLLAQGTEEGEFEGLAAFKSQAEQVGFRDCRCLLRGCD